MTGFNLPDGCTDRMVDEAFGCVQESSLSEAIRSLCEKAGVPSRTVEVILEEIKEWEDDEREPDPDDARDARADWEFERDR